MIETLVVKYGYVSVLVGTFLEGETVLVLAGFLAHRGYLRLPYVILMALVGSLCGDQFFFYLGRNHSRFLLSRRPHWRVRLESVDRLLHRYQSPLILSFRFLYGLRIAAPFAVGMTSISFWRFSLLNAVGAMVWSVVVGAGGYYFGEALQLALGDVKKYELAILVSIGALGAAVWAVHLHRRRSG